MFRKLLIIALLMCAGCASQLNQRHVVFYTEAGSQAEDARDWKMAEQNYERALINANHAFVSDHYKSMAMYNLGRIKGYRCKFGEAEKLLTDALTLEEKISGPQSGITTMRLFER